MIPQTFSLHRTNWVWFSISFWFFCVFAIFFFALALMIDLRSGVLHIRNYIWPFLFSFLALFDPLATIRRIKTVQCSFEIDSFDFVEDNYFVKRKRQIWYWKIDKVKIVKHFGVPLYILSIIDSMPYEYSGNKHTPGGYELGIDRFGQEKGITRIPGLTLAEAEEIKMALEKKKKETPMPQRRALG